MFAKIGAWYNAVRVARKHFVNWRELVVSALLGRDGVFSSRAGGSVSYDAKKLLRKFVRIEYAYRFWGDVLPIIRFEDDSMIIPNYFGRDFMVPLNVEIVAPPFLLNKNYPFDVVDDVVLDIGAYLGDTPLMWLYKGARSVVAVEPVPLHFKFLERNVAGLPVTCLNVSLAVQIPRIPNAEGSASYGLWIEADGDLLDVPAVQLTELVERYEPTVVKLNCEGCEHFVLEQLSMIPQLGVKKIAVQFHDIKGYKAYESLAILGKSLGNPVKTVEKGTTLSGKSIKIVTVYWSL